MIPKVVYETLPGIYLAASVLSLFASESWLRFIPAVVLAATTIMVIYMRYEFRHLPQPEQRQRIALKMRQAKAHH